MSVSERVMEMSDIEWREPGAVKGLRGSKWFPKAVEDTLRTKPGQWALIATDAPLGIQTRLKKAHPGFEFTARGIKGRVCTELYGRFLGETPEVEQ